jgi:hypothetical protein
MACFTLSPRLLELITQNNNPRAIGHALGTMLYHISPLVTTHLEHSASHANHPPDALAWAPEYISAIDAYIAHMRHTDPFPTAFPELPSCRKERAKKARVAKQYTVHVEAAFKAYVRGALQGVFNAWGKRETQLFNKRVDKSNVEDIVGCVSGVERCDGGSGGGLGGLAEKEV